MASDRSFPMAIKVFVVSLLAGAGGAVLGFRLALWIALRFLNGEYREMLAGLIAVVGALLVGAAAMVTAGVMVGRRSNG